MRTLQPGEYTQMAGRAGRRGKDDRGTCILMLDKKVDKEELTNMTCGEGHALKSEFKLTYYGILNLMRKASGEEDAEYVIQRSFHQFQHTRDVPRKQAELAECQTELDGIQLDMSDAKAELVRLQNGVRDCRTKLMHHVIDPEKLTKDVLKPGRLVRVRDGDDEWGWGVLVGPASYRPPRSSRWNRTRRRSGERRANTRGARCESDDSHSTCSSTAARGYTRRAACYDPRGGSSGGPVSSRRKGARVRLYPVALRLVDAVGAMVLTLPKDLTDEGAKTQVGLAVNELHHRFQGKSIPELDFENDLGLGGDEFHDAMGTWLKAESDLKSHALYAASIKDGGLNEAQIATYRAKASLMERAVALKKEIKTTQLSKFREELRHRSRVLCKFGMLTEDGIVTRKGRAACEIDTADELLVTELMFNGCFVAMDHHALVALCAMFMPVEKTKEVKSLTGAAKEALDPAVKQLRETARAIAEAEIEFGVRTAVNDGEDGRHEAVNEYVDSFKDALVGVVYNWSKGTHFDEIMRDTDLFEGTVVRCMRRLDELMMELHRAARAVGSEELAVTFEKGAESLRHGVVSAASLYL
jgi:ATP-dependent RNA helicase DOB1